MKRFYFILYLISSAVWSQVDCDLPRTNYINLTLTQADNGLTGIHNVATTITATNEISNATYLAPEIILGQNFKATAGTESLLSVDICPNYEASDLYVKDTPDDDGTEPNPNSWVWNSPDIWIRNNFDSGTIHQAPIAGQINYIKVRVHNKGPLPTRGVETISVYWAPSTTMNAGRSGTLLNAINAAGFVVSDPLIILQPGESTILTFPFTPQSNTTKQQYSIQANVNDGAQYINAGFTSLYMSLVQANNNIALKNTVLINNQTGPVVNVLLGNPKSTVTKYNFELKITDNETGKPIYQEAEITLKLDNYLLNAWVEGNKSTENLTTTTQENIVRVIDNEAALKNIDLAPDQLGELELSFNFLADELTDKTNYTYHLIQKDALTGEIVGGCSFIIDKTIRDPFDANADDQEIDKYDDLTITAEDIGEAAIYNWYDSEGNLIAQDRDLVINNAIADKYRLEVITLDGFKDYTDVEVKYKPNRFEVLYPNPSPSGNINVSYKINEAGSAYIMVTSYYLAGGIANNYMINKEDTSVNLDLGNYPNGFYKVALVIDGQIEDVKILSKL